MLKAVTVEDYKLLKRYQKGRIIVIDDDIEILKAISSLLNMEGYVCETYTSVMSYFDASFNSQIFFGPSCILCDVQMPDCSGLEFQEKLNISGCCIPMLLMSGKNSVSDVVAAFRNGIEDFLLKPIEANQLLDSINKALALSIQNQDKGKKHSELTELVKKLTVREREVIRYVVSGKTNIVIAEMLGLSLRTVKLYRQRALEKLEAKTVADLVRIDQIIPF